MITIDPAVKQMLERLKGYYASPGAIPESGEPTPAPPPDDDQIKIVRPGAPDPGNFFDQPTPPTGPPLAGGGGSGDSNNFRFDPLGFREVGLLIRGIGPDGFPFQEAKGCTFSMLGERWALGALHCFTSAERWRTHVDQANWQTAAGDLSWSELDHEADRLRAFLQKPSPVVGELEACFDSTDAADCPYLASRVARVIVPRAEWAFGHRIPIPDIALLELEFEVGGGLDRLAELAAGPFAHDRITFAGYGLSDLADHVPGRSLLVSWHTAPRFEAGEVTWTVLPDGTSGGPCSVDSGGPVFGGDLYGYADEQHTLVAIISSMSGGEGERAERCLDSVGFAVPVAPHRADLCELSEGALRGCG